MRPRYYSPRISRLLVSALYLEARSRQQPMTRLVNDLLGNALQGSRSLQQAEREFPHAAEGTTAKSDP